MFGMRTKNPYTQRPLAANAQIIANWRGTDQQVPIQDCNALERPYCRQFVLAQGDITWFGPYPKCAQSGVIGLGRGECCVFLIASRANGLLVQLSKISPGGNGPIIGLYIVAMPAGSSNQSSLSNNNAPLDVKWSVTWPLSTRKRAIPWRQRHNRKATHKPRAGKKFTHVFHGRGNVFPIASSIEFW